MKKVIGTQGRSCVDSWTCRSEVAASPAAIHAPLRRPAARAVRKTTSGVSAPNSATRIRATIAASSGSSRRCSPYSRASFHAPAAFPIAYWPA
jgi:hypothetical protein